MAEPERGVIAQAVAGFLAERERDSTLTAREFLRRRGLADQILPHLQAALEQAGATVAVPRPSSAGGSAEPPAATIGAELPAGEATATLEVGGGTAETFDRRYRIVRELGAGGYGKVYLVQDSLAGNEELALKLIRADRLGTPDVIKRFRNEIRTMRALSHAGIPQIYNDGLTESGEFYYTMAYVRGRSLVDVIRAEAPLAPERVVRLVKQMLDVLDYAHRRGVVHRDLKPANVIVVDAGGEKEQVKVLDFGIAKLLAREGELEHALTMNTEAAIGTPHYMAPEQVRGKEIDGRTDLYALGIMVYQMCTGKMPFTGNTVMEILSARLEQEPTPLEKGQVPEWLEGLVMRLLEREREKRPTAEVVLGQLREVARGQHVIGKQLRWIVAGILVLALSVAWLVYSRADKGEQKVRNPLPEGPAGGREEKQGDLPESSTSGGDQRGPEPDRGELKTPDESDAGNGSKPSDDASQPKADDGQAGTAGNATPTATKEPKKPNLEPLAWLEFTPSDGTLVEPGTRELTLRGRASAALEAVLVNGEPATLDGSRRAFEHVLRLGKAALANEEIPVVIAARDVDGRPLEAERTFWRAAARAPAGFSPAAGSEVGADGWAHGIHDERTGLELVLVPAEGEQAAFYIGKTEVSWAAFERVMKRDSSKRHDFDQPGFDRRTLDDHPVLQVDPLEAQRFCESAGFVLPTRDQWVRAAGGIGRAYPFGAGPARGVANLVDEVGDDVYEFTAPCGAMKGDVSPLGVLDLGGNVREWCREGESFTVSGGSWSSDEGAARVDFAPRRRTSAGDDKTGFRVVLERGDDR